MIRNIIVVSDLHAGCQYGLYPANLKIPLDGGGVYNASPGQQQLWECWNYFWHDWVPHATHNEKFVVVVNGDAIDGGAHHGNNTHITANISDQVNIAYEILAPIRDKASKMYLVKGTESHVGKSAEYERYLAERLNVETSWDLWLELQGKLCHFAHHIGTTQSTFYASTAPLKELVEMYNTAGRWKNRPPDIVIRSHRHQCIEVRVPSDTGYGTSATTGCWQLRVPYSYRLLQGRAGLPDIGGHLIRLGDEELHTRFKIFKFERNGIIKV
jgi:hypothetical protein